LRVDQIRCIALSTHWEELRAPFSEFSHFSAYESIAIQLIVDNRGTYSVKMVECEYEIGGGEAIHNYIFFEFKSEATRNGAYEVFLNGLSKVAPNLNSVLIKLNAKPNRRVINPYGFSWSIFRTGKSVSTDELYTGKYA
jgi:hypothetical protein